MGSYTEENSPESQTFVENPIGDWRKLYPSRRGRGGASVEYFPAVTAGSDGRIEATRPDLSPGGHGHSDHGCRAMRFRHRLTVFAQALDMQPDRLADLADRFFPGHSSRHATGQIRNIGGVVPRRFLNHDGVLHGVVDEARNTRVP